MSIVNGSMCIGSQTKFWMQTKAESYHDLALKMRLHPNNVQKSNKVAKKQPTKPKVSRKNNGESHNLLKIHRSFEEIEYFERV